jgi:AcrR family transcriptional regulator
VPRKTRALRSDARRNREHVLEVARHALEVSGIDVPIDDIARQAGLGIGTVYRHFPTKQHLIAAIVCDRMTRLADDAAALARDPDPGAAFFRFLDALAGALARKRDLGQAITSIDMRAATEEPRARLKSGLGKLLRRAQTAGAIRGDVQLEDVIALLAATTPTPDRPKPAVGRLLSIVRDGLRA